MNDASKQTTKQQNGKARFIRRISALSNAIATIDNEVICFIIFCLNCIRRSRNATYEPFLNEVKGTKQNKETKSKKANVKMR